MMYSLLYLVIFLVLLPFLLINISKYKDKVFVVYPVLIILLEYTKAILEQIDLLKGFNGLILVVNILILLCSNIRRKEIRGMSNLFYFFILLCLYLFTRLNFEEGNLLNIVSRFGNFIIAIAFFFVGYAKYNDIRDLMKLNKNLLTASILFVLITFIYSSLKFGEPLYDGGVLYGFRDYTFYYAPLVVLISPIFFLYPLKSKNSRFLLFFLIISFIIITVVSLMRTAWLILAMGTFILLVTSKQKKLRGLIVFFVAAIAGLAFFLYSSKLYLVRETRFSEDYSIENEGRIMEFQLINEFVLSDTRSKIFGSGNLFDEVGKYGYEGRERALHGTFSRIIFGSGYLGLALYVIFFCSILLKLLKLRKHIKKDRFYIQSSVGLAILLTYPFGFFSGSAGIGYGISYVSIAFLYIGIITKSCYISEQSQKVQLAN